MLSLSLNKTFPTFLPSSSKIQKVTLICFCSFDLFCPLLEKDNSVENFYILCCLVPLNSVLFKPCLFRFTIYVTVNLYNQVICILPDFFS